MWAIGEIRRGTGSVRRETRTIPSGAIPTWDCRRTMAFVRMSPRKVCRVGGSGRSAGNFFAIADGFRRRRRSQNTDFPLMGPSNAISAAGLIIGFAPVALLNGLIIQGAPSPAAVVRDNKVYPPYRAEDDSAFADRSAVLRRTTGRPALTTRRPSQSVALLLLSSASHKSLVCACIVAETTSCALSLNAEVTLDLGASPHDALSIVKFAH